MRISCITCLLLLMATPAKSVSDESSESFRYKFYKADVFKWQNGSGRIPDTKGAMAEGLEQMLKKTSQSLNIAIYGILKQSWFLKTLKGIDHKAKVHAVVDQKSGQAGQWDARNFTYADTPLLARQLTHRYITPDIHSNGNILASSVMHNKFIVVDKRYLWFGSANISATGLGGEYNANIALVVDSPWIARIYQDEFRQMFLRKKFSRAKVGTGRKHKVYGDGTEVEIFFSPQDKPRDKGILPALKKARKSINIAMFFLTDMKIAEALAEAVDRGVEVRVIQDALSALHSSSKHIYLREQGVNLRIENWGGKMHMKTAVIDDEYSIVGSMNWSVAGHKKNDENTMIIRNKKLAKQIQVYYEKLWSSLDKNEQFYYDPHPESLRSLNSCFDGLDNDYDGKKDSEDTGCQ